MKTGRHRARHTLLLLGAIAGFLSTEAVLLAAEPLTCQDQKIFYRVKEAYESSLMVRGGIAKIKHAELKEVGVAAPPAGVNQYAPSKDYFNKSRYCEAVIELDNGKKDQGYIRIDGRKDPIAKDFNFELCTVTFDTFQDGCKDTKPAR